MASQVVAFLRRSRRGTDWSQEEIAELYRIEHALLQARFSLETDRGVSDEGDPWFVFCRADGEVLVHITRSDEGYLLFGLGLPAPLTGRMIGDISKSFVNQIPLNIPVKRQDGPQLFVHPAAALAIIVGMIFLANDDVALVASDHAAVVAPAGEGSTEPVAADRSVKAFVLAVLGKLGDGALLGGPRVEASHQEGNYLSIVCTIAAVMMGASVALDDGIQDFTQSTVDTVADASADTTQAHQASADVADSYVAGRSDSSVGDPLSAGHSVALSAVPVEDGAPLARATVPNNAAAAQDSQQKTTTDSMANLDLPKSVVVVDEAVSGLARPIMDAQAKLHTEAGQHAEAGHAPAAVAPVLVAPTAEAAPEVAAKQAASDVPAKPVEAHHEGASVTSGEASFRDLFKTVGLSDSIQIDRVVMHATFETLNIFAAPVVVSATTDESVSVVATVEPVSTPVGDMHISIQIDVAPETTGVAKGPDVEVPPIEIAQGDLHSLYDLAARTILFNFFQENPNAQAIFYDGNALVFDADDRFDSEPQMVKVWETDTGETITLVGHAHDLMAHA